MTSSRPDDPILFVNGSVYCPSDPFATSILVHGDTIAWIGENGTEAAHAGGVSTVVDLEGALVTPAFVDSHLHVTATGLVPLGVDLTHAPNLAAVLDAVAARVAAHPGQPVVGFGWDERTWPEGRAPRQDELDRAGAGLPVFLDRVDVHSSVVSGALVAAHPQLRTLAGFDPAGWLRAAAHDAARAAVYSDLPVDLRLIAQRGTRQQAAALGICALHEMGGPDQAGAADLQALLALAATEPGPQVAGYWAQWSDHVGDAESERDQDSNGVRRALTLGAAGAAGAAGDIYLDGTIGSESAWLRAPYASGGIGDAYADAARVAAHVSACTEAGVQAGFHVIGDAALDAALDGFDIAAASLGAARVRAMGHRLEHVELVHPDQIPRLAAHGIVVCAQPGFDQLWGGPESLYADRLGDRWRRMNPFADLVAGGVALAFGSDAPVTPMGPWAAVRAAAFHHNPDQRLSVRAAFSAHTRGGWRAAGGHGGILAVGAPAHLAVWDVPELVVQAPDARVAAWSTDPRSGTPGLPLLDPEVPLPTCLRTMVAGRTVHHLDAHG